MSFENILVTTQGRVGIITLNRPQALNALNDTLVDEIGAALDDFEASEDIAAIIITGSEKSFAAGADIGAMANFSYMDAYKGDYITRNPDRGGWRRGASHQWRRCHRRRHHQRHAHHRQRARGCQHLRLQHRQRRPPVRRCAGRCRPT